jgi:hypothetical protein
MPDVLWQKAWGIPQAMVDEVESSQSARPEAFQAAGVKPSLAERLKSAVDRNFSHS